MKDRVGDDCSCELQTCHHKGQGHGHGPVGNSETVVMAAFRGDKYDEESGKLKPAAFRNKQLQRQEVSLARPLHTSLPSFNEHVVGGRQDEFVGIASADAAAIRRISYPSRSHPEFRGRGVCLVDKVGEHDHDGHAALCWSESQGDLTEKQKERARETIKENLATAFGPISGVDEVPWAGTSHGSPA